MREALEDAVRATAEHDARIVVLRGSGRAFSAGADLKDPDIADPGDAWAARRRAAGRWGRLLDDIEALPQVTVAALHGPVIGGAALLAVACDLRVAAPDLALAIPEVALGIPLTWGGIPRLMREVGVPRTRELILTGRRLGAGEALAWGLVHRVGDLEEELERLLGELRSMPAGPIAVSKDALRAHGRAMVPTEAAWSDPDLLDAARHDPESEAALRAYLDGLGR